MTKQLVRAETSSKTEVPESNTHMGLGTPAYCLRFVNSAEATCDLRISKLELCTLRFPSGYQSPKVLAEFCQKSLAEFWLEFWLLKWR